MTQEAKATYGILAIVIIFLAGMAYFLQLEEPRTKPEEDNPTLVQPNVQLNKQVTNTIENQVTPMDKKVFTSATITTNKGAIEITFEKNTPITVEKFGTLAASDFYSGVRFHRVIKDFMIQTGDPNSKDIVKQGEWGMGGPGYKFNDELTGNEQYPLGTVAMANSGPNTNGSQFFIVTANPGYPLPPNYTVFGHVTKGIETVLAIQAVKTGQSDRPLEDIIIEKMEVR